jgi:hypothetical protein
MLDRDVRNCVLAIAAVALCTYAAVWTHSTLDPIHSDGFSYYVYLPAWFIYHDPSFESLAREYGGVFPSFTGMFRWPGTGHWIDLHPIGTALSMAPFFAVAQFLTRWSNFPPDGFSFYYQHGAALAGVAYMLAGLALVGTLLRGHFSRGVVAATLVSLTWGTNLFHYAVYDGTFSHAFSFFLVAALLLVVDRWWDRPTRGRSLTIGAIAALIAITRHPNAIFALVVPLYGIASVHDARRRAGELWARRGALALMAAAGVAVLLPQLAVYKAAAGAWFVSTYDNAGFTWARPHLFGVLISTQRGLFFWSPLLALALLGIVVARGWPRRVAIAAAVVFAIDTYLIASWHEWQFGESYGHRAFTDGFALAAPFLAAAFDWAAARPRWRAAVALFAACAVALSVGQMVQYWIGVMPTYDLTWQQYRAVFLRFQ